MADRKPYWELHVTILDNRAEYVRALVESHEGWKFSAIDGDPVLGAGVKMYATKHLDGKKRMSQAAVVVDNMTIHMHDVGLKVLRAKVERVVYDRVYTE